MLRNMTTYFSVYLSSAMLSLLCTPLIIALARRLEIYDAPGLRKVHAGAIPRLGGVAIVIGMLGAVIPVCLLNNRLGQLLRDDYLRILLLFAGGAIMFFVGLIDDTHTLRARTKLICQVALALIICACGVRIRVINIAGLHTLEFGWFSWPLTILWLVGVTNAINLIDGLDGLAAGIAAITCGVIAFYALYSGQAMMAILMLALLGSLTGFLFFNFNPAKIFMGDCGSLFLGFVLAMTSVICAAKTATIVGIALPILAMGIPIFDTFFSMVRRLVQRRSIFSPDRGHFHHLLLDRGLHQRHVVVIIYLATIIIAGAGMFMMATRNIASLTIFGGLLLVLVLLFRLAGAVKLREMLATLNRNRLIHTEARNHRRNFEEAQLHLRRARTFDQWWRALEQAAEQMNFVWMTLPTNRRDGRQRTLSWRRPGPDGEPQDQIDVTIPVRQRRSGASLRLNVAVCVSGSLESAGRRTALFSRLIDEHSVADLPLQVTPTRRWRYAADAPAEYESIASHQERPNTKVPASG